jgi:hypothetical protein
MNTPQNDPAKWLATIFENSQAMMRQFTQPATPGSADDDKSAAVDPAGDDKSGAVDPFTAASKQVIEMQQNYMRQMTDLWSGMWKLPGRPRRRRAAAGRPAFAAEAWAKDAL